ncbi:MAG: acylphosphatase [Spirochaetaceae bacterium]|jgi:acylphosphatase|nr:acylphosphatase [Spirochaetaceae bacterium]
MNLFAGENLMDSAAFDAIVRGRVQHVGFRYYACSEAERLGVKGWIRNKPMGEVEVRAEGEPENLKKFLSWLHKGPPNGRVDSVNISWREPCGTYRGFAVDYDR